MPRWYKGFQAVNTTPQALVNRLADLIKHHKLGQFVPVARVEKRGGRKGFYFFLGIESSSLGEIPNELRSTLFCLSDFKERPGYDFTFTEIRSMVGAEYDVHSHVHLIPYVWSRPLPDENPFDIEPSTRNRGVDEEAIKTRTQRYNHLLLWLSAAGMGSWDVFRGACQTLGLDSDGTTPQRILRRLRLLGHIETSPDGRRWTVAPPVLARIDDQSSEATYVLCGARDPALLDALRKNTDVESAPQMDGTAPTTVQVRATDAEALAASLRNVTQQVRIADNIAYRLTHLLPALTDWMDTLQDLQGIVPSMFNVKRFDGRTFVEDIFDERKSGFYELWPLEVHQSAAARPKYILFYDAAKRRWLRGDWYGLRFLALQSSGAPRPIRYDPTSGRLAIFEDWRWPELYERVLVLASGRLPDYNQRCLIYDSISPQLLAELSAKLNLQYEEM